MKRLIVHGDARIRKDAVIEYDGTEQIAFSVTRNGDWHGPDEVQLWCIIGDEDEREDFERRNYVPHFLEVESVDPDAIEVIEAAGEMAV